LRLFGLEGLFLFGFFFVNIPVGVRLLVKVNQLFKFDKLSLEGNLTVEHSLLVSINSISLLVGLLEGDDLVHLLVLVAEISTDLSKEDVVFNDNRLCGLSLLASFLVLLGLLCHLIGE